MGFIHCPLHHTLYFVLIITFFSRSLSKNQAVTSSERLKSFEALNSGSADHRKCFSQGCTVLGIESTISKVLDAIVSQTWRDRGGERSQTRIRQYHLLRWSVRALDHWHKLSRSPWIVSMAAAIVDTPSEWTRVVSTWNWASLNWWRSNRATTIFRSHSSLCRSDWENGHDWPELRCSEHHPVVWFAHPLGVDSVRRRRVSVRAVPWSISSNTSLPARGEWLGTLI